jgi:hypothetical protein
MHRANTSFRFGGGQSQWSLSRRRVGRDLGAYPAGGVINEASLPEASEWSELEVKADQRGEEGNVRFRDVALPRGSDEC